MPAFAPTLDPLHVIPREHHDAMPGALGAIASWVAFSTITASACVDAPRLSNDLEVATTEAALGARPLGTVAGLALSLALRSTPKPETDDGAFFDLLATPLTKTSDTRVLATDLRTANIAPRGAIVVITHAGVLAELTPTDDGRWTPHPRLDRVYGTPVFTTGTTELAIVSRHGEEPGESDLWLVPLGATSSERARPLFAEAGADDHPTMLPDGRVLFVSTRTTIASLWLGDPRTGALAQLTNRGLTAGRPRLGFVPPPESTVTLEPNLDPPSITYDAGDGARWMVGLASGRGEPITEAR